MNKEKLISKIRKLFALGADGSNEAESESAMRMARKMLDKFNLTEGDIVNGTAVVGITIESGINMPWIRTINREISRLYDVEYVIDKSESPNMHLFIGKESNRVTSTIVREFVKETIRFASYGMGNGFRNAAAFGVRDTVNAIMVERSRSREEVVPGTGLIPMDISKQSLVENTNFINKMVGEVTSVQSKSSYNNDGRAVGAGINLGVQIGGARLAIS